jgi:hypothetical protein
VLEKATGVLGAERRDRRPDGLKQGFAATRLDLAYQVLYLAEGFLYGVEVRRVGRQVQKLAASPFDELSYPLSFVGLVGLKRLSITTT